MEQSTFSKMLDENLETLNFKVGSLISGVIVDLTDDWVVVHVGLKSEPIIARNEFLADEADKKLEIGDEVKVTLEAIEDGHGSTRVSRLRAMHDESWSKLEESLNAGTIIKGYITGKVRGGMTVEVGGVRAFLPGSLVDTRPLESFDHLEKSFQEFKVIKLDKEKSNVVLSRKAVQEDINSEEREKIFATIQEGSQISGVIKNLTDYGAFVDLGGIDGLLHITDITWKRINHPSEVLTVGEEVELKVTKFDKEKSRISLGLKQLSEDPWENIKDTYPINSINKAKVSSLTDYGFFAELDSNTEGLVHVSEIDWTNKNIHPSKVVSAGDEVDVMVLEIDVEKRRISLGMKQCVENPWLVFADNHSLGDKVEGEVSSLTDFGMFVGLDGGIDGLIHLSDLSWTEKEEEAAKNYKKGQKVEAIILAMDAHKERISLGIKQLTEDHFETFAKDNPKGTKLVAKVTSIEEELINLTVDSDIPAILKLKEVKDNLPEVGSEIEALVTSIGRKDRLINLSIRAMEKAEEKSILKENVEKNKEIEASSKTSIGDLIKDEIEESSTKKDEEV
jgi:small subunit ribosomal protein S1|tara:strand:- start:661 stop:2349 length:1689 start_codon:yes stop_codon:yes gene_type:complete